MTAQILQFPKPGDQPFTIGQCVAFADRLRATKLPRQQRRTPRRHPMLRLLFVVDRRTAGLPPGEGKRSGKRCFWHVSPSGDYSLDVETGRALAQQYLEFRDCEPPPLQWIVEDMPRDLTGIEIGFLSLIGRAASPRKARQIRDHESRVMAAFAEANGEPEAPGV